MNKKWAKKFIFVKKILERIQIPFLKMNIYSILNIYYNSLFNQNVSFKAAGISWSFFLSLFPFILFLLSILPYMPHYDRLQYYVFEILMNNIFPDKMRWEVSDYIQKHIAPNLKSISNFTILLALVFATNGTYSLINGFNANLSKKRVFYKEFFIAFAITLCFSVVLLLSLFGVYYSEVVLKLFKPQYEITWFVQNLSQFIGFFSFPIFYFFLLCLFYWSGCLATRTFRESIPGAAITTFLFVVTTYIFAIYIKDFATYNLLYGSIGSIILLMLWVNLNILLILLGNDLNLGIQNLKAERILEQRKKMEATSC